MALIIPKVFSEAVLEKLDSKLRTGRLATDYTAACPEIMQHGDTVHFPVMKRTATAVDVVKGTDLNFATLDMDDVSVEIKQVASPFRVYDVELAQLGVKKEQFVTQTVDAVAKRIDSGLAAAVVADAAYKSPTAAGNAITEDEICTAIEPFGDDLDGFAGMLINSRLINSFMKMDAFTSASKTYAVDGNGMFKDGLLGYLYGIIPIIVSNTGTFDETAQETISMLLKRDALGYVLQKDIEVKEAYNVKQLATDMAATALVGTKLIDTKGACILRKTVS